MPFSGLGALSNSYRSFFFAASNQVKFISRTNIQLKANIQRITTCVPITPCLHKANFVRHYCSKSITVIFKLPNGTLLKRSGEAGDSARSTVKEDDPEFQGYGSCGGGISCGSCHVILSDEDYAKLSDPISEDENDKLDALVGLTPTSRLACAIPLTPEMDGMILKIAKLCEKK